MCHVQAVLAGYDEKKKKEIEDAAIDAQIAQRVCLLSTRPLSALHSKALLCPFAPLFPMSHFLPAEKRRREDPADVDED